MLLTGEPTLVPRKELHYVAIRKYIRRTDLGLLLSPMIGDVLSWLAQRGLEPLGAPFLRYLLVDMEGKLEVDVGIPIAQGVQGQGQIITGTLPAGTYVMLLHTGHPNELELATANLFAWAQARHIRWKLDGSRWAGRLEWYYSDLEIEPDMTKWETELAFLVEDS